MNQRYSRQQLVSQMGADGQARLAASRVVIVGAGGLGCVVAPLLCGAGVGQIDLVDHDVIELHNLHRQTVYQEADVGQFKVVCLARHLTALNSQVKVSAINARCHADNVMALVKAADVVIDAADNMAITYLLNDACLAQKKVLVAASVNRTFGALGSFCGAPSLGLPSYRAVFPSVPDQLESCASVGVLGPSVAIIGGVQAQEALKVLLGHALKATLWQFELWDYYVSEIMLDTLEKPKAKPIEFLGQGALTQGPWRVVDVREPAEVETAPLQFEGDVTLVNQPLSTLDKTALDKLNPPCVFVCKSGQRALIAAQRLRASGQQAYVLLPDS